MNNQKPFDILSVGELLIDMMSSDFADSLEDVTNFRRLPGGSPANLCMNMARLSNSTKLVATIGKDDMGQFLLDYVQQLPIDCTGIQQIATPTTLILITRTTNIANFAAYRGADCQIIPQQFSTDMLKQVSIFHTTCFALSLQPAQSTILKAAHQAAALGCTLSIDANYAQKIWKDRATAQKIVAEYCSLGAMIKMSEVDWERLYEHPLKAPQKAIEFLLNLGAKEVCLTLGSEGCWVANQQELYFVPARKVPVKDTTGAGDAFWSGYLTAFLDGHRLENRAKAGRKMAEMKINQVGALPKSVDRAIIYEDFSTSTTSKIM